MIIVEETIKSSLASNHYLLCYKNKEIFLKNPVNSLFKIDLNFCICIYNYDLNKKNAKIKHRIKPLMHHYLNTSGGINSTTSLFQYILFIYTFDEYFIINFDKNEKLRFMWYNQLEKLCNNLNKKMSIYQIEFKPKDLNERNNNEPQEGYVDSRLCFINDSIYLIKSDFKLSYQKITSSLNNDNHDTKNCVKFNINHIKRIGHDKSNRFFIELGKRSVYGKLVFMFKCLNYDLACFLHRKTSQFIDDYRELKDLDNSSNKKNLSTIVKMFEKKNSKIRRYYKILSQNSTKFKDQLSCVLKKLSWSKLSGSSDRLSKTNDDNVLSLSKSFNLDCKLKIFILLRLESFIIE